MEEDLEDSRDTDTIMQQERDICMNCLRYDCPHILLLYIHFGHLLLKTSLRAILLTFPHPRSVFQQLSSRLLIITGLFSNWSTTQVKKKKKKRERGELNDLYFFFFFLNLKLKYRRWILIITHEHFIPFFYFYIFFMSFIQCLYSR